MSASEPQREEDRWTRALVTPEGVDLRLQIADAGQRATAFLIDAAIIVGVLIGLTLICLLALIGAHHKTAANAIAVVWLLGFFLLRNAYFIGFEIGPRSATPGKRYAGLRVAARNGEALTANAIFTRNAMREIEVFLPLSFLLVHRDGIDGVTMALGALWSATLVFFPLLNRDRLRLGDIVAGTWVVRAPTRRLVADLVDLAASDDQQRFVFSPAQLGVYGVKELQVLEQVLRRKNTVATVAVAERIRQKIQWSSRDGESDYAFLDAYYLALRRRLEQEMLLGRRRRDKHDHA
ncbi:MAG: RDD family protein [Pseudomonadota bacterium]|nr:RDD family protein [Pseudomonadota bacterium]